MTPNYSRREFIKLSSCGLASLAFSPEIAGGQLHDGLSIARVTTSQVKIYSQPDKKSPVVYLRNRDELLHIYYPVNTGAGLNPHWYRVWGGFAHSAYLQTADVKLNSPISQVPEKGILAEVTVPYTITMRYDAKEKAWLGNYRLYYGSTHWLVGVGDGPDGEPWYKLKDSYDRTYHVKAVHLRVIPEEELTPIRPNLPNDQKYIKVSIQDQTLVAYEKDQPVFTTQISSGVPQLTPLNPGDISSETPMGDFHITVKTPSRHMGDKKLTDELETQALPGIPWVSFFHESGVSLHGTYWHANFGIRMSHGCINMRNEDARWIYRWALPVIPFGEWQYSGWGTRVSIS
jgi:lipoprotein-anchoring transpeptidase ErfK/SrfK